MFQAALKCLVDVLEHEDKRFGLSIDLSKPAATLAPPATTTNTTFNGSQQQPQFRRSGYYSKPPPPQFSAGGENAGDRFEGAEFVRSYNKNQSRW